LNYSSAIRQSPDAMLKNNSPLSSQLSNCFSHSFSKRLSENFSVSFCTILFCVFYCSESALAQFIFCDLLRLFCNEVCVSFANSICFLAAISPLFSLFNSEGVGVITTYLQNHCIEKWINFVKNVGRDPKNICCKFGSEIFLSSKFFRIGFISKANALLFHFELNGNSLEDRLTVGEIFEV
jgi:hypothetical protein